jgi:hypothetical protein
VSARIGLLTESRLDALAAYLAGFEGIQSDPAYWKSRFRLWWDDNPAFDKDSVRGWTLQIKERIVGFVGSVPSRMLVDGEERVARSITTWMVDAPFRNDSLAMLLELLEEAEDAPVFDTTPTDHVAEVLRTLDFEPVPWGGSKEDLYTGDPSALGRAALGALGGAFVGPVLGGLQRLRARLRVPAGLRVEPVDALAERDYDRLWERTRGAYGTTNVRDASAVRWAALADGIVQKRLYECRDAGKLRGFLILKPRVRRGLDTFECADLWNDPDHPEAFDALVSTAARESPLVSFPHFTKKLGERLGSFGMAEIATRPRKNLWLAPKGAAAASPYFCLLQGDYATAP